MNKASVASLVSMVGRLLASQQYQALVGLDRGHRLTAASIEEGVRVYGRRVVPYPPGEPELDIDAIDDVPGLPRRWSLIFPLWTAEEGRSDLSVVATLIEGDADKYELELDDLRVL